MTLRHPKQASPSPVIPLLYHGDALDPQNRGQVIYDAASAALVRMRDAYGASRVPGFNGITTKDLAMLCAALDVVFGDVNVRAAGLDTETLVLVAKDAGIDIVSVFR